MKFGLLFRIIRQRFWLIMMIFLITAGTAAVVSYTMQKVYGSKATLFVDIKSTDPITGENTYSAQSVQNYLTTQVSVILSEKVAGNVVDRLGLLDDPMVMAGWQEAGGRGGREQLRNDLIDEFLRDLDVEASRDGTTIEIGYESTNPQYAADVVNAFSAAYIEGALSLATDPAKEYAAEFRRQTETYRQELEAAQKRLSEFQQQSGIINSDENVDVENQRLSELTTQLVTLEAAAADSESRRAEIRRNGRGSMPEVVANPLVQTLQADVGRAEARLRDLGSRFGPNHPQYISAKAQLDTLRARLDDEINRVASSILASDAVNQRRLATLRQQVADQRAKVLELKKDRNQISALQREVDSAQKAYDLVRSRFTQTDLESKARQSNVSVLSPGVVPTEPSRPKPKLNIAIGGFLGLLIGSIAALSMEAAQKPLRNSEDLLGAIGVPVLAVLPPASTKRPQRLVGSTGPTIGPPNLRLEH